MPLETRNGRQVEVEFVSNVYAVDDRQVIQCNIRDITERKQAEEALRPSETFLDSIIEHSPHAMWISDAQGTLIRQNQACREDQRGHHPDPDEIAESLSAQEVVADLFADVRGVELDFVHTVIPMMVRPGAWCCDGGRVVPMVDVFIQPITSTPRRSPIDGVTNGNSVPIS